MRALLLLASVCTLVPNLPAARTPEIAGPRSGRWAHEAPRSLAPDPTVVWGRLDNGFRYALLPHRGVPGRVAMQFIVLAGSLDEQADELGMAHYVEHLAFGGTRNFLPGQMILLFQRLGVEYGSDVNAITTFDYTAYRLDFSENQPGLLRDGLRLFRDFGDGLTFDPAMIERERRVVLAELRNRNTLSGQQQQASLPVVFRGLQFPQRSPGGSEAQIAGFTREKFLQFYQRNYRPDLMVLVATGDFDRAAMEAQVREIFGDMVRPTTPVPARAEGKLDARTLRAGVFRINGVSSAATEVSSVAPLPGRLDARETQVERQRREFVMEVFAERLRRDGAGGGAQAGYEELLGNGVATASLGVPAPAWSEGLQSVDQLVRLTLERGLDPVDVENHRRRQLRLAAHLAEQVPTLDPGVLNEALTESITAHAVYPGVGQIHAWMREWLERFTAAEAQKVFRSLWTPEAMAFHVAGGVDLELTPEKVLQAVQKGRRGGLNHVMPRQRRDVPFQLPAFASPTTVTARQEIAPLGASLLRFGNNVRLNFIPGRQEPGIVHAVVRVGTGLLEMPGNKPALKEYGLNTLLASGAVHFRPEQFAALTEERLLQFGFDVADRDAFTFRGVMAAEQLEVFLGLVADILHAPVFNSFVHRDQRSQAFLGRAAATTGLAEGLRELTDHLFKGDPRFMGGSPLDYLSMSVIDVRRWMEPSLARGYVEATIVGDVPEAAVVGTVGRTLGALRPRADRKATATSPRPVKVTAEPGFKRIEFVGEQNVGLVVGTWPITVALHVRDQAALEVLAKILELRVRAEVREKLGLAYSPSAEFQPYDGFPDFALLRTQIDCAPNDSARVAPLITAIGARLAAEGVTEGEFIGARGILQGQLRQAFRENAFLVTTLMRAQERPEEAAEIVALHDGLLKEITQAEVNQWAARVLGPSNCRSAAVVPKAFVGVFDAAR
ncbi:MAG: insulinase family protein [Verrucomicrobia bacterium]|nr:insulinase family protein [Verrucomicrobiota bacterium]